ncbi:MAG TPA: hypothetical protein VGI76_02685, partial [Solirubrobacteraceae bacterium]
MYGVAAATLAVRARALDAGGVLVWEARRARARARTCARGGVLERWALVRVARRAAARPEAESVTVALFSEALIAPTIVPRTDSLAGMRWRRASRRLPAAFSATVSVACWAGFKRAVLEPIVAVERRV